MSRIGFVSTRFAGNDGVSLESEKWAGVLEEAGHEVFWFAGELDRPAGRSMLVPEAHFTDAANRRIEEGVWGRLHRSPEINRLIGERVELLRQRLHRFVEAFGIDILIVENALTIPMQIPLGVALTLFIAETGTPTIAHHHDFYWERTRFAVNAVRDYLEMAFPPSLPQIQHTVINSAARDQLAWRKGLSSVVVPNVLDFERPPDPAVADCARVRERMEIDADALLLLQPTRVVPRKGIEHAITLASRLRDRHSTLLITHESGDEGDAYLQALQEMAREAQVDLRLVRTVQPRVAGAASPEGALSLWEVYPCADLVTYPSLYEGFGNALLEAFYFRVPVLINRYSIFVQDIEPRGFRTIAMDGFLTPGVVDQVRRILRDPELRREMVESNFSQARRYYSYAVLRRRLQTLLLNVTGMD